MAKTYLIIVINHELKDFLQVVHLRTHEFQFVEHTQSNYLHDKRSADDATGLDMTGFL